jgi:ribosomal protein L24E
MPDVIEPAASGRAKCRGCGEKIEKGVLRFGESLPNPYGESEETRGFYHLLCAAESRAEKLAAVLASVSDEIPERASVERAMRDALANPKLVPVKRAERSPTSRATCQDCKKKIEKGTLRVVMERDSEIAAMATTYFVHAECAKRSIGAGLADKLRRASAALGDEDHAELARILA